MGGPRGRSDVLVREAEEANIVVAGYMLRHPLAGNVLAYLQYVIGLRRLGHDVVYLEESGWPRSCYDPATNAYGEVPSAGLRLVRHLMSEHAPGVPVIWVDRSTRHVDGSTWSDLRYRLAEADLLLNIGGVCWLPEFETCRRLALVDMDPLFTQAGVFGREGFEATDVFFTYGGNVGAQDCSVPTGGLTWLRTAPPVVPDLWSAGPPPGGAPFTTVANWSGYGHLVSGGQRYGQKDEEFLRLLDLPNLTTERLEVALSGAGDNGAVMRANGWSVRNGGAVSVDFGAYRHYILSSRGELSAAKNGYVKSRSGWFSDRSVCYLAAGRPVILQDTGFSNWIPTGVGLLAFSTVEDAASCLEKVSVDYDLHRAAARELALELFSYEVVLPRLVQLAL